MTLTAESIVKVFQACPPHATLGDLWQHSSEVRNILSEIHKYAKSREDKRRRHSSKSSNTLGTIKARQLSVPPVFDQNWTVQLHSFLGQWSTHQKGFESLSIRTAYEITVTTSKEHTGSALRLRFLHLLFFDISKHLSPSWVNVSGKLLDQITNLLTAAGLENPDADLLRAWLRNGKALNSLIEVFGEGCLFFLPDAVAPEEWQTVSIGAASAILENLDIKTKIDDSNATWVGQGIRNIGKSQVVGAFQSHQPDRVGEVSSPGRLSNVTESLHTRLSVASTHQSVHHDSEVPNSRGQRQRCLPQEQSPSIPVPMNNTLHNPVPNPSQIDTSDSLSQLLYSFGGFQIQQRILLCGLCPQRRWNHRGDRYEINLLEAGLNEQCVRLFSTREQLEQSVKFCMDNNVVTENRLQGGGLAYSLTSQLRVTNSCQVDELMREGLIFISHIFPREDALHDSFHDLGKLLLPYLERIWRYVLDRSCLFLPLAARESLTEASLAASRLTGIHRAKEALAVAVKMQQVGLPEYLQLAIVNRQSAIFRSEGYCDKSDSLIQNVLNRTFTADIRSHCLKGRLLLSQTENAIFRKEFDKAGSYLEQWDFNSPQPSPCETQVLRLRSTVFGRLSRYQGDFKHAEDCLALCLKGVLTESSRYHHMHHLADVYCELQRADDARNLLKNEMDDLRSQGKERSKAFRRLLLPWAEACIQQHEFEEANSALDQLDKTFSAMTFHDVTDHLDHVRSIFGLLRIAYHESRWSEALDMSNKAYKLMQQYKSFSDGNFYIGVNVLFRVVIHFELREVRESWDALSSRARYDPGPRYFIPGLGTYVLQELQSRINVILDKALG